MNKYFQTLVFALAAMFTFSVSADEVSDLKGMMEDLQERINDLEDSAEESGAAGAARWRERDRRRGPCGQGLCAAGRPGHSPCSARGP